MLVTECTERVVTTLVDLTQVFGTDMLVCATNMCRLHRLLPLRRSVVEQVPRNHPYPELRKHFRLLSRHVCYCQESEMVDGLGADAAGVSPHTVRVCAKLPGGGGGSMRLCRLRRSFGNYSSIIFEIQHRSSKSSIVLRPIGGTNMLGMVSFRYKRSITCSSHRTYQLLSRSHFRSDEVPYLTYTFSVSVIKCMFPPEFLMVILSAPLCPSLFLSS